MSYAPGMGVPVNGGVDGRDCGKAAAAMIDGVAKYKDDKISELQAEVDRLKSALNTVKGYVVGEAAINWSCGPATYQSRLYLADVCDAALTPNA